MGHPLAKMINNNNNIITTCEYEAIKTTITTTTQIPTLVQLKKAII